VVKYNLGLIFVILILCSTFVVAESFDISTQVLLDEINIDQEAKFLLIIKNNLFNSQDYRLTFGDIGLWQSYTTEPLSDYFSGINGVNGGDSFTTKIILKPISEIGLGFHNVVINVEEVSSKKIQSIRLPIYIKSINPNDQEYFPQITTNIQFPNEIVPRENNIIRIDPRENNIIRIALLNKNRKDLTNVEVRLESGIIKKILSTSIEPLSKQILEVQMEIDPLHPPEFDTLYSTVIIEGYTFKPDPIRFEIIDYSGEYKLTENVIKGFLKTTSKRVYTNDGNMPRSQIIKIETSLLSDVFESSDPSPNQIIKENDKRYRVWNVQLAPGGVFNLELYNSYRSIFYLLLISVISYYLYLKLKSPIVITKETKNIEMREGGISEVKVLLSLKNISHVPIERITIIDKVPNIANVTSEYDVGTLRPSKIMKHAHKGSTIVQWDVEELDAHEDRLIVYRIKSRLTILGKFSLPLAMVKFHTKSGKLHKVFSNRLVIGKS